jgi:ParB family chromosome partitioning protein
LKPSGRNLNLTSYDDIFQTEENRIEVTQEKVIDIPLTDLHPFKNHPFKVTDDESMLETAESINKHGVLVPVIARPREEGGYELISGHRRKRASELAGKETLPCIVRNLDDDAATIIMVDSNIQRENILPSERAFAYKLKLEAMKHQGQRNDLTSGQVGTRLRADEKLADSVGDSARNVQRFIRLTELVPELLDMIDAKRIAFNPAVELSYLMPHEQVQLMEAMDMEQSTPSLSQAQRLKKYSQDGKLTFDVMTAIMSEDKKGELDKVTLTGEKLKKYFPKSYTPQQMEETILKLLEGWSRKRQQSQER